LSASGDEFTAGREIFDEGFLRQHVLSPGQGAPHESHANVGMRRDVEDRYSRIAQQRFEIICYAGLREERVAPRRRTGEIARADRCDIEPMALVSVQMRATDAAGAEQSDADRAVLRHRRQIRQLRRRRLGRRVADQRVVARGGLVHGSNGKVRRSWADSAAVSTMR